MLYDINQGEILVITHLLKLKESLLRTSDLQLQKEVAYLTDITGG